MVKLNYSSRQCHMILQKSFYYAMKHFLLSMFKTAVQLNISVETMIIIFFMILWLERIRIRIRIRMSFIARYVYTFEEFVLVTEAPQCGSSKVQKNSIYLEYKTFFFIL